MAGASGRATIELSMIVKDGAAVLGRCLESAAAFVDRITIGDTGSTDESVEIARAFWAEVVPVRWDNDFSKARNEVLAHARCEWILVLDADEMLDESAGVELARLAEQTDIVAFDVDRWNYVAETNSRSGEHGAVANPCRVPASAAYPAYVPSRNTRLFRRDPSVYFERPVHESVTGRLDALGLRRAEAPFVIHHFGHVEDTTQQRKRKNELYQEIGSAHQRSCPEDGRTCFELGLGELEHYRRPECALAYFEQAIRIAPGDAASWLFAGVCKLRLGKLPEALAALEHSQSLDGTSIVLQEALGDVHFHHGAYETARRAYVRARELGSASALIEAKLGATLIHLGQAPAGVPLLREAVRREPLFAELHDVASAAALLAGEISFAREVAVKRLALGTPNAFHFCLAANLCSSSGDWRGARGVLESGLALFPDDPSLKRATGEITVVQPGMLYPVEVKHVPAGRAER